MTADPHKGSYRLSWEQEANLLDQVGHVEGGEWRLLRDLHHDHISGRQGWAQFPRLHQEREVPLQKQQPPETQLPSESPPGG